MAKIKNLESLAKTPLRAHALQIAEAGLAAIDTSKVITRAVRLKKDSLFVGKAKVNLKSVRRVFVVGVGKCALTAGKALEKLLGRRLTAGIAIDIRAGKLQKLKTYSGTHPYPTQKNVDYTKKIIELLSRTKKDDLVIFVISGGASTLLCQPTNHTCQDETVLISCLYSSGATIQDINVVRKHLSIARGGYLAKYAYPSRVVSLIFSDVPGNKIGWVASGPTVKDTTTAEDAKNILRRYNAAICGDFLEKEFIETPKDNKYFRRVKNFIVATNQIPLQAMQEKAKNLGYKTQIITDKLTGEAQAVGQKIIRRLHKAKAGTVQLYGGETTVKIKGGGKGGRNMELALSALKYLKTGEIIVSFASDGRDNSEIAGGICDIMTKTVAGQMKLNIQNFLNLNDSYNFYKKTGHYLVTGETGSNISDLIVALKK